MRRIKRKYKRPKTPFDKARIEEEKELRKAYGLRRKREIWRAEALLRKYRRLARRLSAKKDRAMERILIQKLSKMGLLRANANLDDVLSLTVKDFLERRLQTIIFRKGLANTPKHARQLIVHGKVRIGGRRVVYPSRIVDREEEKKIEVKI